MTTLQDYLTQVSDDILHDPNNRVWSVAQLTRYINEARKQLAMDTGCLRTLNTAYVSQGLEVYGFGQVTGVGITNGGSGYVSAPGVAFVGGGGTGVAATATVSGGAVNGLVFTSFGSGYTAAPAVVFSGGGGTGAAATAGILSALTYDVMGVSLVWGAERYSLLWQPFTRFTAWMRQWLAQNYQTRPVMFSTYGASMVYVAPTPDQTYQVEFDVVVLPFPLVNLGDVDTISESFNDPVKFYAGCLAKLNKQSYGEAEMLRSAYKARMNETCNAWQRRIPNPYEPS
jgi:hypothetical protein